MSKEAREGMMHSYRPEWPAYALDWSPSSEHFCTLAVASFKVPSISAPPNTPAANTVKILSLTSPDQTSSFKQLTDSDLPVEMVATKVMWSPTRIGGSEYLGVSGDGLQLWRRRDDEWKFERMAKFTSTLASSRPAPQANPPAPITSFDWSMVDPRYLVTSSYDTTCTIWNIETGSIKTQLIAHDREVYDVATSPNASEVFVSVGAEGSLRLFDIRTLDHSTILYETGDARPLLRVQWNRLDGNYLTCFGLEAQKVIVIDIRAAAMPVATLSGHDRVQAMRWAPHTSNQLVTCDQASIRLWDLVQSTSAPAWGNQTATTVQQIVWPAVAPDWLALGATEVIQVFQM